MNHNPHMTSADRVIWRLAAQAAFDAARAPETAAKIKALKKALSAARERVMPDLRPLPAACFRAFLTLARGFAAEPEAALRAALAARLEALADAAGDILDGLCLPEAPHHAWQDRADLK